jgi:tetratricopeptide (TPR) repeat protein
LNNLARLYEAQGRYADAEPLYRRSLQIREKALGAAHPDVGASLNGLAGLYRAQGRYAEAEPLFTNSGSRGDISDIVRRQTESGERENGQIVQRCAARGR